MFWCLFAVLIGYYLFVCFNPKSPKSKPVFLLISKLVYMISFTILFLCICQIYWFQRKK